MKSFFRGIRLILTLDCEGSARLTSEGLDRDLGFFERMAIRCHNSICKKSRKLAGQLKLIHEAALQNQQRNQLVEIQGLSEKARERIQESIDQAINDSLNNE